MRYKNALAVLALATGIGLGGKAFIERSPLVREPYRTQTWLEVLERSYTSEEAKAVLSDPAKFEAEYKRAEAAHEQRLEAGHFADILLDEAGEEDDFLRDLVEKYAKVEIDFSTAYIVTDPFIPSKAIGRMRRRDDAYFIKLFEEPPPHGHTEGARYHIRTEALLQIQDLDYVQRVIIREALKSGNYSSSPASHFLSKKGAELDPGFVDSLAQGADDYFIRLEAIGQTSNEEILRFHAGLSHQECNYLGSKPGSPESKQLYRNHSFRERARQRLAELGLE